MTKPPFLSTILRPFLTSNKNTISWISARFTGTDDTCFNKIHIFLFSAMVEEVNIQISLRDIKMYICVYSSADKTYVYIQRNCWNRLPQFRTIRKHLQLLFRLNYVTSFHCVTLVTSGVHSHYDLLSKKNKIFCSFQLLNNCLRAHKVNKIRRSLLCARVLFLLPKYTSDFP